MFRDRATWLLLWSNAVTLVSAVWQEWPLLSLLWPYWIQNVVIGYYARRRILALERFSTTGFTINDQEVAPTVETQKSTATFFALHFGVFHLVYLLFLRLSTKSDQLGEVLSVLDWVWILALAIPFVMSHGRSHREHVEADLRGLPNIGTLMFIPYLRVFPMHLTIIGGAMLESHGDSRLALALFVGLKTVADLGMHAFEHRSLEKGAK